MNTNKKSLNTLSDRLVYALEITGVRKAELARAIDVKPQVIQFLCTSNTVSSRFTFEIATALGLNTRWLATGEGEIFLNDDPKNRLLTEYKRIPLLETEHLLELSKNRNFLEEKAPLLDWLALKTKNDSIFCTKINDPAMEPILPTNSIVFLELINAVAYVPLVGDLVLAAIPSMSAIIIREIKEIKGQVILAPKNDMLFKSTDFTPDIKIIGVIIECHITIKRGMRE